jgi:lysyl-tRNA synthetase class I
MDDLKKKVLSSLAEKFSKKKDEARLEQSKVLINDVFKWYEDGGPEQVKSKMEDLLGSNKTEFDEAVDALMEGVD